MVIEIKESLYTIDGDSMKRFFLFMLFCMIYLLGNGVIEAYQKTLYKPFDGVVIALDAGHGGKDQGAILEDVKEAKINLEMTKKLEEKLISLGSHVVMTRHEDVHLSSQSDFNKSEDMKRRVNIINDEKVDLFISIHQNTYPEEDVKGAQVFYKENSEELAYLIQNELNPDRMIKKEDYYILRESRPIGVLIECGFITNMKEKELLVSEKYQHELTDKIIQGLVKYLNNIGYE